MFRANWGHVFLTYALLGIFALGFGGCSAFMALNSSEGQSEVYNTKDLYARQDSRSGGSP